MIKRLIKHGTVWSVCQARHWGQTLEQEVLAVLQDILSRDRLDDLIARITAEAKVRVLQHHRSREHTAQQQRIDALQAAIARLVDHIEQGTAALDVVEQRLAERRKELERLSQAQPNLDPEAQQQAEAEAARVERLLHKVMHPHVFRLPNLLTGDKEELEIRDTRALIDLLYHDIDGSRAALTTLLDQVVIHPCGPGMELELIGTLGRMLRPWFPDEMLFLLEAEKEAVPVQVTPSGTVDNGGSGGAIQNALLSAQLPTVKFRLT